MHTHRQNGGYGRHPYIKWTANSARFSRGSNRESDRSHQRTGRKILRNRRPVIEIGQCVRRPNDRHGNSIRQPTMSEYLPSCTEQSVKLQRDHQEAAQTQGEIASDERCKKTQYWVKQVAVEHWGRHANSDLGIEFRRHAKMMPEVFPKIGDQPAVVIPVDPRVKGRLGVDEQTEGNEYGEQIDGAPEKLHGIVFVLPPPNERIWASPRQ